MQQESSPCCPHRTRGPRRTRHPKDMTQPHKSLALASLPTLLLAACSGSDSNDGPEIISALSAPDGVSVVEADESDISTGGGTLPNAGSQFPVDSDYVQDAASVKVFDPSIEALDTANSILCEIGFTRFFRFVNAGPYVAQLDTSLCGQEPEVTEGDGVQTTIHVFTMDVERESNTAPQTAKLWLPLEESGTPTLINAVLGVNTAPSAADRFGDFQLTYAGVPDGGTVQNPLMYGVLASESGELGFRFLENFGDVDQPAANPGDFSQRLQLAMERDPVTGSGAAKIVQTTRGNFGSGDSGAQTATWRVVFDGVNVKRQLDAGPVIALSRGSYTNHVYSYNLYHNGGELNGQRVELNAGIGVELPSGSYGWVGYYGAWAPFGETFSNGDTVTADDGATSYTVVAAPGRLNKHTRSSLQLSELGDQRFEWWQGGRFQIAWSGVEWQRVAEYDFNADTWTELGTPTMIDVAGQGGFLSMWSQFLGSVSFEDGDSEVNYFQSELVTGEDDLFTSGSSVELYATIEGLKGEISQTDADNGDVYLPTPGSLGAAHKYALSTADMTLMHDVNGDGSSLVEVGLDTGVVPTQGPNTWGMRSGPLFTAADLASMSDVYDVFDLTTFYSYETGHNPWNGFVGLTDSLGDFVTFDAPIEFLYTHSTFNDMNADATFDGQQILLSYNGGGKLFGIPGEEIDIDGDMATDRYFPNFSLKDGAIIGESNEYIVRAIGVDQTLQVDAGGAPQLDLTNADSLTVPPVSIYETPLIGEQPVVEGPPAVIDGVIQINSVSSN